MKKFILSTILTSLLASSSAFADTDVTAQTRELAFSLSQQYRQLTKNLHSEINQYKLNVSTTTLGAMQKAPSFVTEMRALDVQIRDDEGLSNYTSDIMEVRLANKSMLARWQAGQTPLFAWKPEGDDNSWQKIQAYDVNGNLHYLDAHKLPEQPVLVVDTDSHKELKAWVKAMNDEIHRLQTTGEYKSGLSIANTPPQRAVEPTNPISTTVLNKIWVKNDEEPWILGGAEMYSIVTGVNPSVKAPSINVVDMPYLDDEYVNYKPNQVLVYWDRYRWGATDVIVMEKDDNMNYKTLAKVILEAAASVLNGIPAPNYAVIAQMTARILDAMPDNWFTNDDDFVDAFYTLRKDKTYKNLQGARRNATVDLTPLMINPSE